MSEHEIDDIAKWLGLDPQHISRRRKGFKNSSYFHGTGRPKGKPKRPKGNLTVKDVFGQYGIPANILQRWRHEGMPFITE